MGLTIDSSTGVGHGRSIHVDGSLRRRSRTGCLTCKVRRVKCDETKPSCKRCGSTGRKCDGYARTFRITRQETPAILMVVSDTSWLSYDHNVTKTFQYFCEVTAPGFVNYGTQEFWNSIVLSACHTEESIRHLVIAISYLDYGFRSKERSENLEYANVSFLTHYGKAMRLLSNHNDVIVVLIACLLFVVCEDYKQNTYAAITHIQAARRLVAATNEATGGVALDMIASILQMLVIHSPELSAQHLCITRLQYNITTNPDQIQSVVRRHMSISQFRSVKDASTTLKPLVTACLQPSTTQTVPTTRFHVVPGITENLNDWLECLNILTAQADRDDFVHVRLPLYKLRVRHLCLQIISRCAPFDREMLYDSYQGDLDGLTKKLSIMLELGADDLLAPLFFIACKYRDPAGRRRAAEMLRYQACGEEGIVLADIADCIISMEEDSLDNPSTCGDVPEAGRYRPEAILADPTVGGLQLVCRRYPYKASTNKIWSRLHNTIRPSSGWNEAEWRNAALLRALNFHFDQ